MNILIAFDGSDCAKLAIHDLESAGLSRQGVSARILSVGEFVFPLITTIEQRDPKIPLITYTFERLQQLTEQAMCSAEQIALEGEREVKRMFPGWSVDHLSRVNSVAETILEVASTSKADLIVMGSHGRSFVSRIFLGSVSLRVSSEASCSVRVVKHQSRSSAPTILFAFDDSKGSRIALKELLHREWPRATAVHLTTVADINLMGSLGYMEFAADELIKHEGTKESRTEHILHSIECELRKKFVAVTSNLRIDAPVRGLLDEAHRVNADMIFLGSHGHSRLHRLVLGSVAHGILTRAGANVEIVRSHDQK